jgi:hypothetical protein
MEAYLSRLDQRLRLFGTARGLAASAFAALALTLILTWIGNEYRFAAGLILPLRLCLFAGIACVIVFALAMPLTRMNRRNAARLAEKQVNEFGERLLTLEERRNTDNPFNELIAEDALTVARAHPPEHFVPNGWMAGAISGGAVAVVALVWLITSAPGYWGYGASLLWTNSARDTGPLYDISVAPGNATVRRRTDQIISAHLKGFTSANVMLHAKYRDGLKWEQIPMQAQPSANGYQLLFAGLSDSLEYFVEAGGSQSKHFTLAVKDLPAVKRLRVDVHFPAAVGLPDTVQDPGGDIRALEGSNAEIRVLTDKPLQNGVLVMDNGSRIPLTASNDNWLTANVPIKTDGSYHVAAMDNNEAVRITDNYIIEARKDEAPTVSILKPGKDAGVSPIEELPVTVSSSDDFGLRGVELHYSVNGGPEKVKTLAGNNNAKSTEGKAVLPLEEFKLNPGDLVSFYATAKDATHTSRSDIYFAKVEPFDLKFRQSQQSAGGGGDGAGDQNSKISERQKDIIAATWNQVKDPSKDSAAITQNAHFLSELEAKLGEQAKALSDRMGNRELGQDSQQFKEFSKSMLDASAQMSAAVAQLGAGKWNDALGPEQKGLQSMMHAESLFRDIQVSQGKGSGGSGGGGDERDLARLLDLELDTAKNQYESAQSGSKSSQNDTQKKLDEDLERLKELARRQQQLASEQHSQQQQFQQKWEEEQLRREAEQLRQQLQQQQQQQQQSGSQSASSASASSGSSSSSSSAAQRQALKQAMDALSKAEEEMRNASSNPADSQAQQRAANQLAQAQNAMRDMMHQQAASSLSDLTDKARQLSAEQNDLAKRIKKQYGAEGVNMARTDENGTPEMPEMNGPGYGGWYRRRMQQAPDQAATPQEKGLAEENDKLADKVQQLQKQLQDQAQSLAAQQPDTMRKIRKALSEAEQEEIAVRMRKSSDWLRQGYGSKTWPVEDSITAATQHLSRQLEEAQKASERAQSAAAPGEEGSLGQALAEVRSLREQLQAQSQGAQQSGGQGRPTGANPSQANTTAGGREGQQQSAVDQLAGLRAQFGSNDRMLNGYFNDALGAVRRLDGQAGLLDARLGSNAMLSLERLELELAKRMSQKAGARTGVPDDVPEGYREAVATYFRTLSK